MSASTASRALSANVAVEAVRRVDRRLAHHADHGGPGPDDVDPRAKIALAVYEAKTSSTNSTDPTRTKTIRRDYSAEMYRRFRRVKGLVRETVEANDALRLGQSRNELAGLARRLGANATAVETFPFENDDEKIDGFLDWLEQANDDEVLEVRRRVDGRVADREAWQNVYVRRSYGKGVEHAEARLREQGIAVPDETLAQVFNKPIHADALGILYTRNFRELEGITREMDRQISRVLTEGFEEGYNPRKMAREVNDRVDKVGLTRARTLARTETINAHATSTLNRFEDIMGPDAVVTPRAELSTAGDSRVCEICASLEGRTYRLDEARNLIPIHPNCRCAWLPVVKQDSANLAADVRTIAKAVAATSGPVARTVA